MPASRSDIRFRNSLCASALLAVLAGSRWRLPWPKPRSEPKITRATKTEVYMLMATPSLTAHAVKGAIGQGGEGVNRMARCACLKLP